jgi:hypothetical protein
MNTIQAFGTGWLAPLRRHDWLHREAVALVASNRAPSQRVHDEATTRLVHCYRRLRACRNHADRHRLRSKDPEALVAIDLFNSVTDGAGLVTQALVLAGESQQYIGARHRVAPGTIGFFEEAYFDVRSRLEDRDFIHHHVVRPGEVHVDTRELARKALLMLGYMAGRPAIDLLVGAPGSPSPRMRVRESMLLLAKRARTLFEVNAVRDQFIFDPQKSQEITKIIESIEQSSATYGDEGSPRTAVEAVEAELFAKMRGTPLMARKA